MAWRRSDRGWTQVNKWLNYINRSTCNLSSCVKPKAVEILRSFTSQRKINKTQNRRRRRRLLKTSTKSLSRVSHRYGMAPRSPSAGSSSIGIVLRKNLFLNILFHFMMFFFVSISSLVNVFFSSLFFGFLARFLVYCKRRMKRNGEEEEVNTFGFFLLHHHHHDRILGPRCSPPSPSITQKRVPRNNRNRMKNLI